MKKKTSTPLRSRRSRLHSATTSDCVTGLNSSPPPNSATVSQSHPQIRHLTMLQHSHNLLKFLNEDRIRQKFCDVSVSVGGKLYSAHKVVLAHGSSYFHAELSKNPATTHVTLDHVEDSVFQHLLGFLYTSECDITETDLPALTEAARFLDMMDILKMLCEEGDVHPASVIQAQAEIRESPEVEMTPSDSPTCDTEIHSPFEQSSLCSRLFGSKTSAQNHSAESHIDAQLEASTEKERTAGQRAATARRSARRRRTPTKYKRDDEEYSVNSPEEKTASPRELDEDRAEEAGEVAMENQMPKLDTSTTSQQDQVGDALDEEDEEEKGRDMNEDVAAEKKASEVYGAEKSASQQRSDAEGTEQQAAGDVEAPVSAAGGSNQSPVYPEGLAPVIIKTSNKKTLKCPRCDKTFDRAGENRVAGLLLM